MSFRIEPGRPVGAELERIARELAEPPAEELPVETRVHELRKNCKKLRAIARLVGRKADSRRFRDVARRYGGARDAAVLLRTFDSVAEPGECPELRARLAAGAEEAGDAPPIEPIALDWTLAAFTEADLFGACTKAYRKARRAYQDARRSPDAGRVHEWRKRVKDHGYQMRLVRSDRRASLDELAERLGAANDLAVLRAAILDSGIGTSLLPRVAARREELVAQALASGEVLFGAKPKRFAPTLRLR